MIAINPASAGKSKGIKTNQDAWYDSARTVPASSASSKEKIAGNDAHRGKYEKLLQEPQRMGRRLLVWTKRLMLSVGSEQWGQWRIICTGEGRDANET